MNHIVVVDAASIHFLFSSSPVLCFRKTNKRRTVIVYIVVENELFLETLAKL